MNKTTNPSTSNLSKQDKQNLKKVQKIKDTWSLALKLRIKTNEIPKEQHEAWMEGYKKYNLLCSLMNSIEFVAFKVHGNTVSKGKPVSPKQLVYVEKALQVISQNSKLLK